MASVAVLFAVTNAVLLQPIGDDDVRLVRVWKHDIERGGRLLYPISYPEYLVWKDEAESFDAVAAINYADGAASAVLVGDEPLTATIVMASAELLTVVGATPALGRLMESADDVDGADPVAVVSHQFWQRVGGAHDIVGQRLRQPGGEPFTVVGVLRQGATYPIDTDIWIPLVPAFTRNNPTRRDAVRLDQPSVRQFHVVGRMVRGVTPERAHAELTVIHQRLNAAYPEDYPETPIVVTPLVDTVVGPVRSTLLVLFAGAGLVFLVAGANVATLLLMRAESRRVEMAVRSALGATRRRLLAQTSIEATVLGALGFGGALLLIRGLLALARAGDATQVPRIDDASLSAHP